MPIFDCCDQTNNNVDSSNDENTIYLHGDVEIARLIFTPKKLVFDRLEIDQRDERMVQIKNPSHSLFVTFAFVNKAHIRCDPMKARLKPQQAIDVFVTIVAQYNC